MIEIDVARPDKLSGQSSNMRLV